MVDTCAYYEAEKSKIARDQIVINVASDAVREKLLGESGLTLEKAVDMWRSMEATKQYLTCMAAPSTTTKKKQRSRKGNVQLSMRKDWRWEVDTNFEFSSNS